MISTNLKNVHTLINISKERASSLDFQIVLFKSFSNKCIPNKFKTDCCGTLFQKCTKSDNPDE
jgi:hypothetical protein